MPYSLRSLCVNYGKKYTIGALWVLTNLLLLWATYRSYKLSPEYFYLHEILGAGLCWSRGTAAIINLNLGALLLPMCRATTTCLRAVHRKVPLAHVRVLVDNCKAFHVLSVYILVIASVVHILGHCSNALNFSQHYNPRLKGVNAAQYKGQDPLFVVVKSVPGVTGLLLFLILTMIVSSATYSIRQASYDLFWAVHRLYIIFYCLVLIHSVRGILKRQTNVQKHTPGCNNNRSEPWPESEPLYGVTERVCVEEPQFGTIGGSTWIWVIGPLLVYLLDYMYRLLRRQVHSVIVMATKCYSGDILEIQLRKDGFNCSPGQYVLVNCPRISSFEWHPFTVTTIPSKVGDFSIHLKTHGDWSAKLKDHLEYCEVDQHLLKEIPPKLHVDGPFGSPLEDILRYRVCLCVAGGIGITPFVSLLDLIRHQLPSRLLRLQLLWLSKDSSSCLCFSDVLCDTYYQFWRSNRPDVFDLQLYITSQRHSQQKPYFPPALGVLNSRTSGGRPDWGRVMDRLARGFPRETIGVFCCGPKSLGQAVGRHCTRRHGNGAVFKYHHEAF